MIVVSTRTEEARTVAVVGEAGRARAGPASRVRVWDLPSRPSMPRGSCNLKEQFGSVDSCESFDATWMARRASSTSEIDARFIFSARHMPNRLPPPPRPPLNRLPPPCSPTPAIRLTPGTIHFFSGGLHSTPNTHKIDHGHPAVFFLHSVELISQID